MGACSRYRASSRSSRHSPSGPTEQATVPLSRARPLLASGGAGAAEARTSIKRPQAGSCLGGRPAWGAGTDLMEVDRVSGYQRRPGRAR